MDPPRKPLLAIVGATGTGKSDLAVALAERFNGEIINGDALQLYEGLPIATNKITEQDRRGVPHHLLGCIGLKDPTWTIGKFTMEALQEVQNIRAKHKLPILVGGTHYYAQGLLFHGQTVGKKESRTDSSLCSDRESRWPILNSTPLEMLEELKKVDPDIAAKWHPNDTRKIRRSLEIWLQTGRKASEIYLEQHEKFGQGELESLGLRDDTLCFWTHTDSKTLTERTSARLDRMSSGALLPEIHFLRDYRDQRIREGSLVDESRGIWVAIGYKEFSEYLDARSRQAPDNQLHALCATGLERSKIATRQYAKRQVRWIRQKLLPAFREVEVANRFFLLDSSNLDIWSEEVVGKACFLTEEFLAGHSLPEPESLSSAAKEMFFDHGPQRDTSFRSEFCEVCKVTCTTPHSWSQHLRSRRHKKLVRYTSRTQSGSPLENV